MKIDWKRIEDHGVAIYASCLVTTAPYICGTQDLAVAFKSNSGRWKLGNGKVCWFEPTYFSYLINKDEDTTLSFHTFQTSNLQGEPRHEPQTIKEDIK